LYTVLVTQPHTIIEIIPLVTHVRSMRHKLDRPRPLGGYAPKTSSSATPRVNHIRVGYITVHPPMVCGPVSLIPSTGLGTRLVVYIYVTHK